MLSVAKPILQLQLMTILQEAAYKMYMEQFASNKVTEAKAYDPMTKSSMESQGQKFALKFAQTAAGPVATAIHDFVKEIGIMITVPPSVIAPPLPPALPGGPCSGTIPMTNITIL